jgi:transcriptional regulator with XRE-family HTH domain
MISSGHSLEARAKAYFGSLLRQWRTDRRVSQLTLGLEASISTRHLSCMETGRAQPSKEMVLRLAEALQIPLRERNTLLLAAGYSSHYRETSLDAPEMEEARQAVHILLKQHEPYRVIVTDRYWNTLRMNSGMKNFFGRFPIDDSIRPHNGVRFVFHPKGLRPFIENWESVAARIIQRLHREVAANPADETMQCFLEELLSFPAVPGRWRALDINHSPPPFLTINYKWNNSALRFFAAATTFGTAQDVALQEMRIETFFSADEATRAALLTAVQSERVTTKRSGFVTSSP